MMLILQDYCSTEFIVSRSRFISEAFPVTCGDEVRNLLKRQKEKYSDATHVVHAFCTGLQGENLGTSDAGEPSGTAGKPMLEVIKGSKVTNILITATRYFGGTLLGTGGLVRAYSDCAKKVLEIARVEEYIAKEDFSLSLSYNEHERIRKILLDLGCEILAENFSETVEITGRIPQKDFSELQLTVKNATGGKIIL